MTENTNTLLSDVDIAVYYTGTAKDKFNFLLQCDLPNNVDIHLFQDLPLPVQNEVIQGKLLYSQSFDFTFNEFMRVVKEFDSFKKYYFIYINNLKEEVLIS